MFNNRPDYGFRDRYDGTPRVNYKEMLKDVWERNSGKNIFCARYTVTRLVTRRSTLLFSDGFWKFLCEIKNILFRLNKVILCEATLN